MNLYQPTITGSLSVSGSVNISGSITIAGGGTISGTASIATTALTASFVANAQTASYVLNAVSSSFALTASSADNLLVRNTLTAQTLVVQTITSSVDFVTGSTRFGSSLSTSTHQFTGSVSITGSLAVVTTGTELQVTSTGVKMGNVIGDAHSITGSVSVSGSATFVGSVTAGQFIAGGGGSTGGVYAYLSTSTNGLPATSGTTQTAGALRLRGGDNAVLDFGLNSVDTWIQATDLSSLETYYKILLNPRGGNVAIGMSNPDQKLTINQGIGAINQGIPATSGTTQNGILRLRPGVGVYGETLDFGMNVGPSYGWIQATNASGLNTNYNLALQPNGGNVGIGTSSPGAILEIKSSSATNAMRFTTSFNAPTYNVISLNATNAEGQYIGFAGGGGVDTTLFYQSGNNGNHIFRTGDGTNFNERMRISSAGYITTPAQPAFYAYLPGGATTSTTGNYAGFNTTRLNRGSHYSTSTGRFTAPVAGVYRFLFAALYRRQSGTSSGEISISINGSNINNRGLVYVSNNVVDGHTPAVAELIISLNANDYVMPFIYSVGPGSDWYMGENLAYFGGYLIG